MSMPASPLIWLMTGCSSGLGKALARRVLDFGDRVVATARDPHSLRDLSGENCLCLPLDVTNQAQIQSALEKAMETFGRIDVIVNNAGYGLIGAFEELSEEQVARNFEVNFFGALRVIRAALPFLRVQGHGHFVNVSAAAAIANYPGFSAYGASKCALEGVSESLAAELAPLGIHVTIVQPGPFRTDFLGRSLERGETIRPEYARSSGQFLKTLEGLNGHQPGDPVGAAAAIMQAVRSPHPPLRLALGRYAVEKTRQKLKAREKELVAWQETGQRADAVPSLN